MLPRAVSSTSSRKRKRRPRARIPSTAALTTTTTVDAAAAVAALPPYRLFNPTEIRQVYGQDSVQPVRGDENGYWFQGNRYQHRLLVKRFKLEQVVVLDQDKDVDQFGLSTSTIFASVNVTIITTHPEKGKHAVVRDVVPVFPSTTTRNTSSNVNKRHTVEYPSGLKLIVELSGFTAGRTNPRLNLDYYGVATEDNSTNGTLKWLHEVYNLRPAQIKAGFQPRSVLEARQYNERIPEGDIPLPPIALSYTVSELTRMMEQTVTTPVHMDHVPSAGTTSNVSSTSSTTAQSTSSSSPTGSSSADTPPPLISSSLPSSSHSSATPSSTSTLSLSSSSSSPSPSSASSSPSSISSPPSTSMSSSTDSVRRRHRSSRNLSPPFSNPPCPPSGITSSQSQFSPPSSNLRASPAAAATISLSPPRSPSSVTDARASSVPSDSGAISLGSTEPDISDHWILNPRLRGKKIVVIAHGGGFLDKEVAVIPILSDENEVKMIWDYYNKPQVIPPRWIYPRHPHNMRCNSLLT